MFDRSTDSGLRDSLPEITDFQRETLREIYMRRNPRGSSRAVTMAIRKLIEYGFLQGGVCSPTHAGHVYCWFHFMPNGGVTKTIFAVCAMFVKDDRIGRQRTWGWYASRDDADVDVMNNATDMFECGYYNTCVIEEYREGVMTLAINRWWYKATFHVGPGNETTVERAGEPEWAEGYVNFGMG